MSFTVDTDDCKADLALDWDGAVTQDLNGPSKHGGFAIEAEALRLDNVSSGAEVMIDFYARTLSIDGVLQGGAQGWFAAREADGGLQALTLGATMTGGAWAVDELKVSTVAGIAGGGFVNSMY